MSDFLSHTHKKSRKTFFSVRRLFDVNFILEFFLSTVWSGKKMLKNSLASKSTIPSTIHALGLFLRSSIFFRVFLVTSSSKKGFFIDEKYEEN